MRSWKITLGAILFVLAGMAQAATVDSFEAGMTGWSVIGTATPGPTFTTTGPVGGINPTDGTVMALYDCNACTGLITLRYVLPTPLALGVNDYIAADVYSVGTDRNLYVRATDGTNWVTLGSNNTADVGCSYDGIVTQNQWETVFSKAADTVGAVTLTTLTQLEILIPIAAASAQPVYLDNVRVVASGGQGPCPVVATPTFTYTPGTGPGSCGSVTCTPTHTLTPIVTPPDCGSNTCTFTPTVTPTHTITTTNTLTPTPTNTPWALKVFPNPIDFQNTAPDITGQTIDCQCQPPAGLFGCIKINGIERGATLKIYTLSLQHVRSFVADPAINPYYHVPVPVSASPPLSNCSPSTVDNTYPNLGQIVWDGTNENRNPVSAGIYFYVYEGGSVGPVRGKLAIKRARKTP